MHSYHAQISPEFINHKWLSDDICNVHVLVANGMTLCQPYEAYTN